MQGLLEKILHHADNELVLLFLEKQNSLRGNPLLSWKERTALNSTIYYHQGLCQFMHSYASLLPEEVKYVLNENGIFVNPSTGEIFALQFHQYAVGFKCHLAKNNLDNCLDYQSFSAWEDISELGERWALLYHFDDEQEQLLWAYEQSCHS